MQHKYSVKLAYIAKKGNFPAMRGDIYEGDVVIGTFRRGPVVDGYVPEVEHKFRTQAAFRRFVDFADSLSVEETILALVPRQK